MWIKVFLLVACYWASSSVVLCVDDEHATIRNAMEHMLQVRAPSTPPPASQTGDDSPHLYMMDLYKKYLASESMKNRSNTIRSISPYRGQVAGEEMLMFNLSGLSRSEEIGSVELHFYKRRAVSRKKVGQKMHHHHLLGFALGGDSSVDADDYSSDADDMNDDMKNPQQIGKWEVALDKRGWQVYDVSAALAGRKLLVQQLGFKFQGVRRSSGRYESLSLESVLRMEPSPFLVVFSNERSNATLQETGIVSQGDVNALPDGQDDDTAVDDSNNNNRKRRSIEDNELPEADHHFNNNNVIPQTSPGVLQGRGSSSSASGRPSSGASSAGSRKSGTLPYPKSHHDRTTTTTTTTDSSMLAWPEDKRKGGGGGGGGSRAGGNNGRKGKRRNRKLPETWHYNQQQHINDARLDVPEDAGRSLCQRRKLTVDFNEIGWGEWIISPKTFEAQYCAGRCPFPLTKELNPTNHATIQSIVHAIGGHPEVPAPCCVPDVLSSLTLLYFDDNRNVVLKNYPSMTAESCACR